MIVLCYAGFLRFSEVSSIKSNHVKFFENSHIEIYLEKSKTDQYRLGDSVVIAKGQSAACPFLLLKKYFYLTGIDKSKDSVFLFRPMFRSGNRYALIYKKTPLSYTRTRECIIARLKEVCGDLNIGLHSLRASGATTAANSDINGRCWKRHGRWKSETAKDGYVADSLEHRLQVTKQLGL